MALDERYMVGINLEEYFVDNETGLPLSEGSIEFWVDTSRSTPKPVFQLTGSPPNYTYDQLPNPITLSSVGTIVNNSGTNIAVYYYPFDEEGAIQLYYIVVRDSSGAVQLIREAWPNITPAADPTRTENSVSNELGNSQFVDVLFDPEYGMDITFAGALSEVAYSIAPDWDIVISSNGAGNVTVNRTSIAGSENIVTNPPYQIEVLGGGGNVSSIKLRQRLYHNPDIWASGFIAGHLLVSSLDDINHTISMLYAPNIAPEATTIVTGTTGVTGYVVLSNTIELAPGTNTDTSDDGYVDIEIVLPVAGEVAVTSVQLVGLETDQQDVIYDQEPVNRQEDHLFHYYNPLLQYKGVGNLLQGWDFPLNPRQFSQSGSLGAIGANKSAYAWDQTIIFQSANSGVSYQRTSNPSGWLDLTAVTTTQMAIVQYIQANDMNEALNSILFSAHIRAFTNQSAGVTGTISLWHTSDASLPNVASGTNNSMVLTLNSTGKPTLLNGNWTEIPRSNLGDGRFSLVTSSREFNLSGWQIPSGYPGGSTYFAIVVGFSSLTTSNSIFIEQVNLCPGHIASPCNPLTYASTLQLLQRYYEKSYASATLPGANTAIGEVRQFGFNYLSAGDLNATTMPVSSYHPWRLEKRATPNTAIYSPSGVLNEVQVTMTKKGSTSGITVIFPGAGQNPYNAALSTYWTVSADTMGYYFTMIDNNATNDFGLMKIENNPPATFSQGEAEGFINYQITADARLGIVL